MQASGGKARVVVVGSFNVDHVWRSMALPQPGATLAGEYSSGPGGKGFNQAVAAARAGAATAFLCALGEDAGGQLARDLARDEGIALMAQRSEAPTGTAGIFTDARGRNCIVVGAGANAHMTTDFIARHSMTIASADVVLAQLESPVDAVLHALTIAREGGTTTVLNPAPSNVPVTPDLLGLVDILTPNETEFAALLSRHADQDIDAEAIADTDDETLHALARRLLPGGSVMLTLGAAGLFVSHPESTLRGDAMASYRIPAEAVHAIDTVAAGDACSGALCASIAGNPGAPFRSNAVFANRYAALSTEHAGAALSMPRRDAFDARFPDD